MPGSRQGEAPERKVVPFDMRWRLGYHGVATLRGFPHHAFGHFGFGGSGAWADPHRDLSVGLIVNSGIGTPFGDLRIVRISGVALACADELRKGRGSRRPSTTPGAAPGENPLVRRQQPSAGKGG
jgi:CubicO group peptidase (beta-lactamase class C family)